MSTPPRILFPVAVDPDALLDFKHPDHKQTHIAAERFLRDHGVLSYGPGDKQALHRAVGELVGRPQSLWAGVMEYLKACRRVDEQSRTSSIAEFLRGPAAAQGSAEVVRLVLAGSGVAASTVTPLRAPNTTELVTLPNIDESTAVKEATGLRSFASGSPRDHVGVSVLRPLGLCSKSVTVLDPHLFDSILGTARPQRLRIGGQWIERARDHVEWLVAVLADSLLPEATLRLIGEYPTQRRLDGELLTRDLARREIQSGVEHALRTRTTPMTVNVTLVQAPKPDVKASNRYMLFDCGVAFLVDHDFTRLGSPEIPGPEDFLLNPLDAEQVAQVHRVAAGYTNFQPATARLQWDIEASG